MAHSPGLPYDFSPLATQRLNLRLLTTDDVDVVYSWQSREDVCRYLLFEPRTRERVAEVVARHAVATRLAKEQDYLELAVELPATDLDTGRVIGSSYFCLQSLPNASGEIGWTMHPDYTGRGYATEAANAILDLAFGVLGLHRVYAELDVRNDASVALCRRLGMREEAHHIQDMMFKGAWSDTGIHAILVHEWRERRVD